MTRPAGMTGLAGFTRPHDRAAVRRGPYGRAELAPLISPESIAVVGASNKPGYGLQALRAIRGGGVDGGGFGGELYAVHPRETDVDGVAAVPSVRDLPGPVDLAAGSGSRPSWCRRYCGSASSAEYGPR